MSPVVSIVWVVATAAVLVSPSGDEVGGDGRLQHVSWKMDDTPLDRSAAEVGVTTDDHVARAGERRRQVLAVSGPRTLENTLVPLNELYMHLDAAAFETDLLAKVHPDGEVRAAADAANQAVSRYRTELNLDRALYDAIAAVDLSAADAATRYAVEKDLRNFRRAGVDQPDDVRARLQTLDQELVALGQEFVNHISGDVKQVRFDPAQLAGLPPDYVAAHPAGPDGKVVVNTTTPDYQPFVTYAHDGAARRELYLAYQTRAYPQNLEVLDGLMAKRHEKATLLGYPSWAAYITEDKMIGSDVAAERFIERIAKATQPVAQRDYDRLLAAKRRLDPQADSVADWEKAYFANLVQKEEFRLDPQEVRAYFEYEAVRQGIFDLCARLFGVTFRKVSGLDLWHEDVTAWDLLDGGRVVGRFFLDMHPRPDKYGHAACFSYRNGIAGACLPQAALVCNFPNPRTSPGGQALMEFTQVETFLHEFGHLIHQLFASTSPWALNAGISNEWDFVEAPSQMLEEFLVDPQTLQSFAKHHETGESIPVEMIEKLRRAAEFGKGTYTAHQMFYAALSLNCYRGAPPIDTDRLVQDMQARYSPFAYVDGAHFQCSFGHLEGYSAIYYTYMWSQVIAKDLFSRFEESGVLDPDTARRYREAVLAPGSSRPAADLVQDFLGREYGFETFETWLKKE